MRLTPHPYTLRQLQYAAAVADSLSFRKAAERCHVSQPSLSAQLAGLEDALGVRLFERDRRRVLATRAGQELLARVRRVLLEAEDLAQAAREHRDPLAAGLRIGVIPTISPYLLPEVSPTLRRLLPRLRLAWVEDRTAGLVSALEAGALDAAVLALEARLGDFEAAEIARDPFVLAVPAGHPLAAHSGPAALKELRESSVLLLDDGHCFRDQALAYCSRAGARELEFRATSLATLAQMVAGGAGVTLLPRLALPTEGRRAELEVRELAPPAPYRTIAMVWRRRSPLGPSLRRVAETIAEAYPTGAYPRTQERAPLSPARGRRSRRDRAGASGPRTGRARR
jgi:LysR family hydrogen peroxide-inducible transcriptional activator